MPAAAAVLLESEARARAAARARARRNGRPPDEQEPPPPRLAPIAAAEVAATLERALRLSRGPAGSFLLASDSAVDIGVLRDPGAVAATTAHSGLRKTMHKSFAPARLANMHVPFLNLGSVNIGLAVGRVELVMPGDGEGYGEGECGGSSPGGREGEGGGDGGGGGVGGGGDGDGGDFPYESSTSVADPSLRSRLMVMGRYARDEQTGEMLTILQDLRPDAALVSLLWLGPALGDFVRERLDIVCDASVFATGRMEDSVLRCERTVRVGGGIPAGLLPEGPLDMRHCRSNLGHLAGSSQDFLMGLPAFQEQLEISDPSARDHLMSIAVQSRVGTIYPDSLGVEAAVTLYKTALDISMLRLSEMTISAGETAPENDLAQSAADVMEKASAESQLVQSHMTSSALGMAAAQSGILQSALHGAGRAAAHDSVQRAANVVTLEELTDSVEDAAPEQNGGDLLQSVDRSVLAETAFLPGAVDGDTGGLRASCVPNDSPWLLPDNSGGGLYARENGEPLRDFLESAPKSPNVEVFKRARTDGNRPGGAENDVLSQHRRAMPRPPVATVPVVGSFSGMPPTEGSDLGKAVENGTASGTQDTSSSPADDEIRAKRATAADNQVVPLGDEAERKKAIRRQKNIEAARRSNQRRKRAYDDLVHVVELARKTESKLRQRQSQLVIENAALRLLIDRAEGRWKP